VHARVCEHWLAELPDLQRICGCLKGRLHLARPVWGGGQGRGQGGRGSGSGVLLQVVWGASNTVEWGASRVVPVEVSSGEVHTRPRMWPASQHSWGETWSCTPSGMPDVLGPCRLSVSTHPNSPRSPPRRALLQWLSCVANMAKSSPDIMRARKACLGKGGQGEGGPGGVGPGGGGPGRGGGRWGSRGKVGAEVGR
jgi:hypothetical protein